MPSDRRARGFTMLEMMVVVTIVLVLATAAIASIGRQRPRARLTTAASEVHALIHGAHLSAMASGKNVVVMIFPQYVGPDSTGRLIVYEDGDYDFFSALAPVNFGTYAPGTLASNPSGRSQVLDTLDLPPSIIFGPATGMGAGAALPAPLDGIDVTKACSFCGNLADGRGAVMFDARGRAWFYGDNGPALSLDKGASFSLTTDAAANLTAVKTMVITTTTGAVRALSNG
jgi:prepilin-type N-terminal cleavage/methylation domain-containing protein